LRVHPLDVYHAEIKYVHPDGTQEPEEKRIGEPRTQRLNLAYEALEKARQEPGE